jgi:hypothetical protein
MLVKIPHERAQSILNQLETTFSADSWMQDRIGAMETTSS